MSRASSQLRVYVHFREDTVFAGEDVECTLTFKNVEISRKRTQRGPTGSQEAANAAQSNNPLERLRAERSQSRTPGSRNASATRTSRPPVSQSNLPKQRRPSSFSVVESANSTQKTPELPGGGVHIANAPSERKHGRKISIVSLGGDAGQKRPAMRHGRSASMQSGGGGPYHLRRPSLGGHHSIARGNQSPSPVSPSPLPGSRSQTPQPRNSQWPSPTSRNGQHVKQPRRMASVPAMGSQEDAPFRFPQAPIHTAFTPQPQKDAPPQQLIATPTRVDTPHSPLQERSNGRIADGDENGTPLAKAFSLRSVDGTPRTSLDVDSMSNASDETLASEMPAFPGSRLLPDGMMSRRTSLAHRPPTVETILMGYAQLSGSFTVDGSLVNHAPFEDVKRKAVVGGQGGGGVVGITRPAADAGLFGAFNWKSIGESLGDFVGAGGPSSMKEMKSIAGSNDIPLLSTAKSILFVDLNLVPGQSKSYSFRCPLPRGLPPTHKGRAMKVSYNLIIGTQRPGSRTDQPQVKQVEIPFRVLSGINYQGEYLGHDLMSPYIILKDQARTKSVDLESMVETPQQPPGLPKRPDAANSSSAEDYASFVEELLLRPRLPSSYGLISPTAIPQTPMTPLTPSKSNGGDPNAPPPSLNALIDHAIRFSTHPSSPIYSPTNFTIARSSIPIASLKLSRPALKMGETLTCMIDFSAAKLACYALEATLESSERVDPALAIRSSQSIERATRRVWASSVENAIWARRCVFRAQIPLSATPAFTTTGVSLDWYVRLELVVGLPRSDTPAAGGEENDVAVQPSPTPSLDKAERVLEVVHADDRGTLLGARQHLACDSFQVEIPIRVFGAVVGTDEGPDLEGLPV